MFAKELINYNLPFLKPTDTVDAALEIMDDYRVDELVLSNGNEYFGILERQILENINNTNQILESIQPKFENIFLRENQHIFEALTVIQAADIQIVAILNSSFEYKGSVKATDILTKYSQLMGSQEIGAIICLKLENINYSLAEISRLVETNNAKIIASYYNTINIDEEPINTLTIKLNTQEISKIVATFERYGYQIKDVFANESINSLDKANYDLLMKYLEI